MASIEDLRAIETPPDTEPMNGYSERQIALVDLVEAAVEIGYSVRSAELAPFEERAEAGIKAVRAGGKGGKASVATRLEKTLKWQAEAKPLVELAMVKAHVRSINKAAEDVLACWKGPEAETPSTSSMRAYIKKMIEAGEVARPQ